MPSSCCSGNTCTPGTYTVTRRRSNRFNRKGGSRKSKRVTAKKTRRHGKKSQVPIRRHHGGYTTINNRFGQPTSTYYEQVHQKFNQLVGDQEIRQVLSARVYEFQTEGDFTPSIAPNELTGHPESVRQEVTDALLALHRLAPFELDMLIEEFHF